MLDWKQYKQSTYYVSNKGYIKNKDLFVKQNVCPLGHSWVSLTIDGEQSYQNVALLVATCFIPNPDNKKGVKHKNKQIQDNTVDNLYWVDAEAELDTKSMNLLKNKKIDPNIYHFWHPKHGEHKLKRIELCARFSIKSYDLNRLFMTTKNKAKSTRGWMLIEHKDQYIKHKEDRSRKLTLKHPEFGTDTLTSMGFVRKYGLIREGIYKLRTGQIKKYKDWEFISCSTNDSLED